MSIESAKARLSGIMLQRQQVFQKPGTRFDEILQEKLGSTQSAQTTRTAAQDGQGQSVSSSCTGATSGTDNSNTASMLGQMLSASMLGGSGGSGDSMSMLLMMALLSRMGGISSSGNTCANCGASLGTTTGVNTTVGASLGLTQAGQTADFSAAAPYMEIVNRCAEKYNMPANLILGVMKLESGFRNEATSKAGAQGLMQLMPGTAKKLGVTDVRDPAQNIEAGVKYLRQLTDMFGGDVRIALAAYNCGPGAVKKRGVTGPQDYNKLSDGMKHYGEKALGYAGLRMA